jgi:hypothetical protein
MAIRLYDAVIPQYLQMLGSVDKLLDKAAGWCEGHRRPPSDVIEARIREDMLPFSYQVKSVATHSWWAIQGVRRGSFSPRRTTAPDNFDDLHTEIRQALDEVRKVTKKEMDGFVDRDMKFVVRGHARRYTADKFLLSFSLPNFYFHAATAYDILRSKGAKIGKNDFIGDVQSLD